MIIAAIVGVFGWLVVASAQEIPSPTRYVEQSFDVLHYDASLALDSLPQPILGESSCTWILRWRRAPDTVRFHLRSLQVAGVAYVQAGDTIPVEWFVRGQPSDPTFHYAVPALPSHRQGDTVVLRIAYRGTMTGEPPYNGYSWGGVQREGSIVYALGVGFYNNYVSATQHWLACYDHPSDKATFSLAFRVPSSYVVAAGGEELPPLDSGSWRVYRFRSVYPAATYLLTFAAFPSSVLSVIRDTTSLDVPIVLYARRADSAATSRSFRLLPRMVRAFEQRFGAYPFEKVGYAMTQKGAMEHQTMISFPTSLARSGDTVNLVAAHELAHQWFGDCTTPLDFRDAWFNESFATFCESLWREQLGGYSAYLAEQQRKIAAYLNQYAKPGNPSFEGILTMYDFDRTPPSSNYPHVIYEKGAAVLGMLRWAVGDSVYFAWCRELLQRYRYANVSIDTLERTLGDVSGRGEFVRRFFAEWIRGKGWPIVAIEALRSPSQHGWKAAVRIRQVQPDSFGVYTTLPLELSFIGSGDTSHRVVMIGSGDDTFVFDSLGTFTSVAVNAGRSVRALVLLASAPVVSSAESHPDRQPLAVYPIPATGTLWIELDRMPDGPIEIYDARGARAAIVEPARVAALSTEHFATGTYYVVATIGGTVHRVSFSVVR
ncbi:MAG: M1 family aminopeptidase [Chlorobi bacterium]|nr:M1 family aminopeptidase [Chlorobiota bacterium]